jgi:hypothetical protein
MYAKVVVKGDLVKVHLQELLQRKSLRNMISLVILNKIYRFMV